MYLATAFRCFTMPSGQRGGSPAQENLWFKGPNIAGLHCLIDSHGAILAVQPKETKAYKGHRNKSKKKLRLE